MSSSIYSRMYILEHAKEPFNYKKPKKFLAKVKVFNKSCGDDMTLYLVKDKKNKYNIYFSANACAVAVSSASMILESLSKNKNLLKKINLLKKKDILNNFDVVLSPSRQKCALLVYNGLKKLSKYEKEKEKEI